MRWKELALAAVISSAIAVAILSMPDVLRPAAESLLRALGLYWPAAVLLIGVIHSLKPDEHTWPITVSYGMMQESLGKAMISTGVFAGALTLVWASLSALTSQLLSFFQGRGARGLRGHSCGPNHGDRGRRPAHLEEGAWGLSGRP